MLARIIETLEINSDYVLLDRFPDPDYALKRLFGRSADAELVANRRFVDSCGQQLRAAEAGMDTSDENKEDSSVPVTAIP